MITSLQVRLFALAIHWPVALTGLRPLSVCLGMLLGGANCADQYQFSGAEGVSNSRETPALIERLKAIELDRVLTSVGEASIPFGQ
jgi:hypothetical protein